MIIYDYDLMFFVAEIEFLREVLHLDGRICPKHIYTYLYIY